MTAAHLLGDGNGDCDHAMPPGGGNAPKAIQQTLTHRGTICRGRHKKGQVPVPSAHRASLVPHSDPETSGKRNAATAFEVAVGHDRKQ